MIGRKKWIFYPPGICPPGVTMSEDGADVTEPISTGEWCLAFWKYHLEMKNNPDPRKRYSPVKHIIIIHTLFIIYSCHIWYIYSVLQKDDMWSLHNFVFSLSFYM